MIPPHRTHGSLGGYGDLRRADTLTKKYRQVRYSHRGRRKPENSRYRLCSGLGAQTFLVWLYASAEHLLATAIPVNFSQRQTLSTQSSQSPPPPLPNSAPTRPFLPLKTIIAICSVQTKIVLRNRRQAAHCTTGPPRGSSLSTSHTRAPGINRRSIEFGAGRLVLARFRG